MDESCKHNNRITNIWIFIALFAASIEPVIVKIGYRGSITPAQLLVFKNLFAVVAILLVSRSFKWIGWQKVSKVLSVSLLLLATNGLVLYALQDLSAITVVTMISITPAFVAIVNQIKGRDILNLQFWVGFILCFLGVLFTLDALNLNAYQNMGVTGFFCMLGAIISSTIYRTRMEHITALIAPRLVSTYIFCINGIISSVFILPWVGFIPVSEIGISLWIGVAAVIANFAFLSAISLVGSTRMSIFDLLQRPMVILFAAVILNEARSVMQIIGVIMVILGVQLAKVKRSTIKPILGTGK